MIAALGPASKGLAPRQFARLALALVSLAAAGCPTTTESGGGTTDTPFQFPELPVFDFGTATPGDTVTAEDQATLGPACCASDDKCPSGEVCRAGTGADTTTRCVPAPTNGCWSLADCPTDKVYECQGASLCGCDAGCTSSEVAGTCVEIVATCCAADTECKDGQRCIGGPPGRCTTLASGGCFLDSDCAKGGVCTGAVTCACEADCVTLAGTCEFPKHGDCTIDAHCPGGICIAGGACGTGCDHHDPTCCQNNKCVFVVPQCKANTDCPGGTCVAQAPCYEDCPPNDPKCCFGNLCQVNKCTSASPAGCLLTGCPLGESCRITGACKPSSCECSPSTGWHCASDCAGGECVPTGCPGKNPGGCHAGECPEGTLCKVVPGKCVPSACTCDETTGIWSCTADCGGASCVSGG